MNSPTLIIRPYNANTDTQILSSVWLEASKEAHAFIGETRLLEQQVLIEQVYLPKAETWVACLYDDPVGFISLLDNFIGGLFVDPKRQGLGIGKRLVVHALSLKRELTLDVYTQNQSAFEFYRHLGFVELSRRAEDDDGLPFENARLRCVA